MALALGSVSSLNNYHQGQAQLSKDGSQGNFFADQSSARASRVNPENIYERSDQTRSTFQSEEQVLRKTCKGFGGEFETTCQTRVLKMLIQLTLLATVKW
ncbi:hypothetical protein [Mycoplasma sp. ATU-Cv-508]|uniref:hypothetical protein n=1 Tax=Mycoplasma sp. ATU-Cv-508 TaxID=2048001 RepID=UPI000FDD04DE